MEHVKWHAFVYTNMTNTYLSLFTTYSCFSLNLFGPFYSSIAFYVPLSIIPSFLLLVNVYVHTPRQKLKTLIDVQMDEHYLILAICLHLFIINICTHSTLYNTHTTIITYTHTLSKRWWLLLMTPFCYLFSICGIKNNNN